MISLPSSLKSRSGSGRRILTWVSAGILIYYRDKKYRIWEGSEAISGLGFGKYNDWEKCNQEVLRKAFGAGNYWMRKQRIREISGECGVSVSRLPRSMSLSSLITVKQKHRLLRKFELADEK